MERETALVGTTVENDMCTFIRIGTRSGFKHKEDADRTAKDIIDQYRTGSQLSARKCIVDIYRTTKAKNGGAPPTWEQLRKNAVECGRKDWELLYSSNIIKMHSYYTRNIFYQKYMMNY